MKMSNELKTGAVVFLALLVLVVMLYKTGDLDFGKKGYTVTTRLQRADGIKKFSPVRLEGVEVGEVKDLKFIYDSEKTSIEAVIWVSGDTKLRKDSLAVVSNLGLMGEKYIEIKSGVSPEFVEAGAAIESKTPVSMEEVFELVHGTLGDARKFINNLNGVVGDNKEKIGRIMDNLELTTEYFSEFAEDVRNHPWKVLSKGPEKTPAELEKLRAERAAKKLGLQAQATASQSAAAPAADTAAAKKKK